MKEIKYKKKDGTEGTIWKLENGDEFRPLFLKPRISGPYGNGSILVTMDLETSIADVSEDTKRYVQLTGGQMKGMANIDFDIGDTLVCKPYKTSFGEHVGVRKKDN